MHDSGHCVEQVREFVRDVVEAAVDTARRTVDAREMAAMPRLVLLLLVVL